MRPRVRVVSSAFTLSPGDADRTAPEMLFDVARRAVAASGLARSAIDFTVSASSDVLDGRSFGFAYALEALGAYPPSLESHLEMDGAWAAYYAWLKLLAGEARTALVVAWGKCSEAPVRRIANTQLDPFFFAPLGLDHVTSAALQADAWMHRAGRAPQDLDEIVLRARSNAARNGALRAMTARPGDDEPVASPLLRRHCPVPADGACALVLALDEAAPQQPRPVFIAGADHRAEPGALGCRDLAALPSAVSAAQRARVIADWDDATALDVVELSAAFAHQEPMLVEALGIGPRPRVSPSGGALVADPIMATGLIRLAECAAQLAGGAGAHQVPGARRGLAHAASGHALQQNLVFLLEAGAREGEGSRS